MKTEDAIIYAIAWAGIMMLFDFSMWAGNVLDFYYDWLNKKRFFFNKAIGLCTPCTALWLGLFFLINGIIPYFIFLGVSEMVLIFYYLYRQQTTTNG